jgi:hypothetical protein
MGNRFVKIQLERADKQQHSLRTHKSGPIKDSMRFWTAISSIAACGATVFAGWAAWETRASAIEAARATKAAVWMQTLAEYASPEMLTAMKELRSWQQQHPKDFAAQYEALLVSSNPSAQEKDLADRLDSDRRRISSFFGKVVTLDAMGVISENEVALTWDVTTYNYVKDVLGPIEHAKVDSMRQNGLVTVAQEAEADREEAAMSKFYARVAAAHEAVRKMIPP